MRPEHAQDTFLIRQIADGHQSAMESLYDRYNRLVFSVALAVVGERSVAEEVTLDVFVHVWRGAKTYDPARAKVSTWLVAITRHHAIDILRWQRARLDSTSFELDDLRFQADATSPEPQEQAEVSEKRRRIRDALAQLPSDQRQVLFLAYFKGHSHQEIADVLKQPLGTIKTRVRLAMQKLRRILVDEQQTSDTSEKIEDTY